METRDAFQMANERGREMQAAGPRALEAWYERRRGRVVIRLASNVEVSFAPADAQGLDAATPAELREIQVTPSGLGIHFPKLGADLYVPAILEGLLGSKVWMAARLGQLGGRSRSRAKRAASKRNGALGGRPRGRKRAKRD